ncbi:exo-beta-N-acetylmuramidase NamZ family protein [Cochleicola gelatinilyticus]|uniref:DUF1343 domain-containing protein n=1 Tax=Cochleicola gelatinilyticus TaxID=1763537 RepID=A0A167KDU6_9FLAO|nr:DUF1343 domain-containing protein [Cochleicola gelatinilyticus]OAB81788.1 hypothetical protein ULVI_00160 [Cochleicola gelatinilyticus]
MRLTSIKNTIIVTLFICFSCGSTVTEKEAMQKAPLEQLIETGKAVTEDNARDLDREKDKILMLGMQRTDIYLPMLKGKSVGVVANQTSRAVVKQLVYPPDGKAYVKDRNLHLVDYLVSEEVSVQTVFAPEHGFRGTADAGEMVKDGIDSKTGIPIVSLYGKNKKPNAEQLKGIDVLLFDIQDVGARFYTYISTLHYVMEAAAEASIPVIVLDRPNPNGHYIDGPIMEPQHTSFVGMHPIPVVHGMTIGEYAKMIQGEDWLKTAKKCDLTVIKMENYNHELSYSLPIKPSPNLPNDTAITLYPSLCFFEGTFVSAGRGTEMQFQIFGAPSFSSEKYSFTFTPQANEGAKHPKFKGEQCFGKDLRKESRQSQINLDWLIEAYKNSTKKSEFFNNFFVKLAGTEKLQQQIEAGNTSEEIIQSWKAGLATYNTMRKPYLLYE